MEKKQINNIIELIRNVDKRKKLRDEKHVSIFDDMSKLKMENHDIIKEAFKNTSFENPDEISKAKGEIILGVAFYAIVRVYLDGLEEKV